MQFVLWFVPLLTALLLAGAAWEAAAAAADRRGYPPPGRLIDIGGRRLHIRDTGTGTGPTVVILTGRFNSSPMWALVQERVSRFARVCAYDRAGYAWSDPDPAPRTGERVAGDLHTLLHKAEIPGPYLLVGHSLGGMYARCFAQRYPDEVAGVILVDPYTEGEFLGQPPRMKAMQARFGRVLHLVSCFGLVRLSVPLFRGMIAELSLFPPDIRQQIIAFSSSARLWRTVDQEWSQLDRLTAELGGAGSLGAKPLLVLSAGRCDMQAGGGFSQAEVERHWRLMKDSQAALTELSAKGRLQNVPDTGHSIETECPEAVVEAVRELLGLITARG